MFGSRTTVKKARNSLTWFSHIGMNNSWSLMATCNFRGLEHTISRETEGRCKTRHHQQGWKGTLFKGCSCPRHNPRCTALIILKEGTRMPMSGPGAFRDRKEDPGCPFPNQCPCQAEVQGVLQTRAHQRRNRQTRLNPERLLIRAKLTGSARTHEKLTNSVPKGRSQIGGFVLEFLISN